MKVTEKLSKFVYETEFKDLPPEVVHEAKRSLVNILGVGIGAANHESVDIILDFAREIGGKQSNTIWGRNEKADILFSTLINGFTSHIMDFDDTHLGIMMHPSAPVAPVIFGIGDQMGLDGQELLLSFILGVEVECKIGKGIYPHQHEYGWHFTGVLGHIGAAVTAAKLLKLNVSQIAQAIGLAGTQASGFAEMIGTMSKFFNSGKASMNGLLSAKLVQKGFTSIENIIEAKRGFAKAFASSKHDLSKITAGLGKEYEILKNSYKPFACGIVAHPSIDGMIRIRKKYNIMPDQIEAVECIVHPYVPVPMGKKDPQTGLESRFSTYHCIAVAFIDGTAGPAQFSDARATDSKIIKLRDKVSLTVKNDIRKDEAIVKVKLSDGTIIEEHVEHAIGSIDNPVSDEHLSKKFQNTASLTLSNSKINKLLDLIWNFDKLSNLELINANIVPGSK